MKRAQITYTEVIHHNKSTETCKLQERETSALLTVYLAK